MIRSFRSQELERLWERNRDIEKSTPLTKLILRMLYALDVAQNPVDVVFLGQRFDQWTEGHAERFGLTISNHWLVSFSWIQGHATDIDLERIE